MQMNNSRRRPAADWQLCSQTSCRCCVRPQAPAAVQLQNLMLRGHTPTCCTASRRSASLTAASLPSRSAWPAASAAPISSRSPWSTHTHTAHSTQHSRSVMPHVAVADPYNELTQPSTASSTLPCWLLSTHTQTHSPERTIMDPTSPRQLPAGTLTSSCRSLSASAAAWALTRPSRRDCSASALAATLLRADCSSADRCGAGTAAGAGATPSAHILHSV